MNFDFDNISKILKEIESKIVYLEDIFYRDKNNPKNEKPQKIYGILTIDQFSGIQAENQFEDKEQFKKFFKKYIWQKEAFKATPDAWVAIEEILKH